MLKYIYDNLDAFRLIFCNSAGTEYEDYFDRLAETEEKFYRDFVRKYAKEPQKISDFFIHVVCRTGWQTTCSRWSPTISHMRRRRAS